MAKEMKRIMGAVMVSVGIGGCAHGDFLYERKSFWSPVSNSLAEIDCVGRVKQRGRDGQPIDTHWKCTPAPADPEAIRQLQREFSE